MGGVTTLENFVLLQVSIFLYIGKFFFAPARNATILCSVSKASLDFKYGNSLCMITLNQLFANLRSRLQSSLLMFLVILFAGSSCKKDTLATVDVDKNEITVFAGITDTVNIRSVAEEWQLRSDNSEIATATIENNKLIIYTHKHGVTQIHLSSAKQSIKIKVTANPLSGGWHLTRDSTAPIIVAQDAEVAAAIRQELLHDEANRIRTSYIFSSGGVCEVVTTDILSHNSEQVQGSFTLQHATLTVTYSGLSNIYTLATPPHLRLLKQDLTSYYQQKYPGAGISQVTALYRLQYFTYG